MDPLSGTPIGTPRSPDKTWQRLISNAVPQDELASLVEAVFSKKKIANLVDSLQGEHVQTFIDIIDTALDSLDLAPRIQRVCTTSLHRTCARHTLVPRSLKIELSGDSPGVLMYRGGFADVWKYQHQGREVAVKVLRVYATSDLEVIIRRFCKEFMQWKALRHPNVLPLLGVRMTENEFAMISEWMPNGNINQFVAARPDADRFELLTDVARGLDYMHSRGVVHGALKGANILIDRSCHACLVDFELLKTVSDSETFSSSAQGHSGTSRWMSPELVDAGFHGRLWSKSSDRYTLGMVIYEVLSGCVPFYQHADLSIPGKVVKGDRPQRPQGVGGVWFTDPVWKMLKCCWVAQPRNRPTIGDVLRCLENPSRPWTPPSLPQVAVPSTTNSPTADTFKLIGKESIGVDGRIRKGEEAKKAAEGEGGKVAEAEKPRLAKEVEGSRMQEEGEVIESPATEEVPEEELEIISRQEVLRIDTPIAKTRPAPLDLSKPTKVLIPAPLPVLDVVGVIEDLDCISYPEGINGPKPGLNVNSRKGKFRYDREFLLQFMAICTEKPDVPLDPIGLEAVGDQPPCPPARNGSGRLRSSSAALSPPKPRQASMPGFNPNAPGGFTMGNFSTPMNKMTSEERFAISQCSTSSAVTGSCMQFGRSGQTTRSSSQGGPGSTRTRTKRGGERTRTKRNKANVANVSSDQAARDQSADPRPIAPPEVTPTRWTRKAPASDEQNVERKVRALLNKLTTEKFDPISDQIIEWANKSEAEKDGRTLIQITRLVFEGATSGAAWPEMYARLCRKMMETISPNVRDDGIRNSEGKPMAGGQLFRKYLLSRCKKDFERGWAARGTAATAAATKASEDATVKKAAETSSVFDLYSDEYCAVQKAKRQFPCLVQFIGELYKVQMLTERIIHEHVKRLIRDVGIPGEEAIESLCRLLTTVGRLLDSPKARAHMDIYFTRMKELGKCNDVAPRMQFMMQDLIELRERKWISRDEVTAPTTIAQVHEDAARQRAQTGKEAANRTLAMSRGGSRGGEDRGGDRGGGPPEEQQADGQSVAGGSTPRPSPKAEDLSNFGKMNKSGLVVVDPSSVWVRNKDAAKRDPTLTSVNPSSNMPTILGPGSAPEPQRRKLKLLPRLKPYKAKIAKDVEEFFSVRDIDESEEYFNRLPSEHHHLLVNKMVSKAIESKEVNGKLVADAFARASEKNLCSISAFEKGFLPIAKHLDGIAIDAPEAFQIMATMMKGAGLDKDEERRTKIARKSTNSDKLLGLLA